MNSVKILECNEKNPEQLIREQCALFKAENSEHQHIAVKFTFKQYWLSGAPEINLLALVKIIRKPEGLVDLQFTVTNRCQELFSIVNKRDNDSFDFVQTCQQLMLPHFFLGGPIVLSTISIKKPWGQELWFTGIEERGVCNVANDGLVLPLPWLLSVFPTALCAGRQHELILLKILDPLPQPIYGDLYFELHQEKREVYVVTAVDQTAWPDKTGKIRFGVNQEKRSEYSTDKLFREAFGGAVKAYETVRRQIDTLMDARKQQLSLAGSAIIEPSILCSWLQELPKKLLADEQALRLEMESFTGTRNLCVGDVLKVPCFTPHSLQHGVRTVEFQTPVYERLIVSFAQKVLTQDHWDSHKAIELMTLDTVVEDRQDRLLDSNGVVIDKIVDFEDFDVLRVELAAGARWFLDAPAVYSLCMVVEGPLLLEEVEIVSEQAVLLAPMWKGAWIDNKTELILSFLLANPK